MEQLRRLLIVVLDGRSNDSSDKCLVSDRCRIVLSPFRGNNTIMFGDRLMYEGVKASIRGGFELTTRVTHKSLVAAHVRAFESLYDEAESHMLSTFGGKRSTSRSRGVHGALVNGIRDAFERYSANHKLLYSKD